MFFFALEKFLVMVMISMTASYVTERDCKEVVDYIFNFAVKTFEFAAQFNLVFFVTLYHD